MKYFTLLGGLPLLAITLMTGCVDNKYNLFNIDTTTEIKVKDLVIPVNLDEVKLGDIITINEGSELNEVSINGQTFYAVNKSGEFSSNDIDIPKFVAEAPDVDPITLGFVIPSVDIAEVQRAQFTVPLTESQHTDLAYEATDIDEAVVSAEEIKTNDFKIDIKFNAVSLAQVADLEIKNVKISLLKGLDFEPFSIDGMDYTDGVLTIPSVQFENGIGVVNLMAKGISNLPANGYVIVDHSLSINEKVEVSEAELAVDLKDNASLSDLNGKINIDIDFEFSPLEAEAFTGKIKYEVTGIDIDPVSLNDIPDFLAGDETDIVLANPQIYLNLNNPVGDYALQYQSGLSIIPVRDDVEGQPLTLDNNESFKVNCGAGAARENIVLSPEAPSYIPEDFNSPAPSHYGFSGLSYAISGNGVPQQLKIELINPQIPTQRVVDFRLGSSIEGVKGKWQFLAPLALKSDSGSQIIYTDRKTGWNDKDVDAIKITQLTLSMTADSKLPLNAELSGYPIDINGNRMTGVSIKPVEIKGMTDNQSITLVVEGVVEHLDGFEFTAKVNSASDEALSPQQTLVLKNIRAKASGSYTKEL